ncbi:MAG: hypothetical protein KF773_09675 [Deltaproteobacteria bacterium]|nr:hypothetical protein [Deltaproteobacteria bacterium]
MMRWWVLCAPLAGCNLLFGASPGDPPRDALAVGDGPRPDASCTLPTGVEEVLLPGSWFVADRATQRAVMFDDDVRETVGDVDTHLPSAYMKILEPKPMGVKNYDAPRLAPGGAELFVILETVNDTRVLARAERTGVDWSAPAPVELVDDTGAQILDLELTTTSPPTTSTPRRMMVSRTLTTITEFQEDAPSRWKQLKTYTAAELGTATADGGYLTPDGLQLVFAGDSVIRIATRQRLEERFSGSQLLFTPTAPVTTRHGAYYTVDCQRHLYYTSGLDIRHVVLP